MEAAIEKQEKLQARLSNAFDNFKKTGAAKMTKGAAESRLLQLDNNWAKFEANHDKILLYEGVESEKYITKDLFTVVEEAYLDNRGTFKDFLNDLAAPVHDHEEDGEEHHRGGGSDDGRLRRLEIPKFSGDFREWPHFRDLFESMVSNRHNMPNIIKLQYLQEALQGEAADLLKSIPISGDQFRTSFQALKDNYENERLLVNYYLSTIVSVEPVKSESSSEMRRVLTVINNTLGALEALDRKVSENEDLLVFLTVSKLDVQSRKEWETHVGNSQNPKSPPTFDALKKFMETRRTTLESLERSNILLKPVEVSQTSNSQNKSKGQTQGVSANTSQISASQDSRASKPPTVRKCFLCSSEHLLYSCPSFREKSVQDRKSFLVSSRLCFNCMAGKHPVRECSSLRRCNECKKKHHTLIHTTDKIDSIPKPVENVSRTTSSLASQTDTSANFSVFCTAEKGQDRSVLLSTAWISVASNRDGKVMARALIDQGAQGSFISEYLCSALKLSRSKVRVPISGVGSKQSCCQHMVEFTVNSHFSDTPSFTVKALVLPKITNYRPNTGPRIRELAHLQNITLADPQFFDSGPVDVLLGADIHALIVENGIRKGEPSEPVATCTSLGWLLSGGGSSLPLVPSLSVSLENRDEDIMNLIQKFWEVENLHTHQNKLTPAEQECEEYFSSTFSRNKEGRYIVRLAFKDGLSPKDISLGDTYTLAARQFISTEKRFLKSPKLREGYIHTFEEYLQMGHMVQIPEGDVDWDNSCFLTHHGIIKESSTSTKFRVVFNGSLKSLGKGISLNDLLHIGENLYPDLLDLILRWRLYPVAFSADIEKMFRQLALHQEDQRFQYILWRFKESDPIAIYSLTYPCFGLGISPFLASRVLRQMREDYKSLFPEATEVLSQIYMDNIQSGAYSVEEAIRLRNDLIDLLKRGCFPLKKWMSNEKLLLDELPADYVDKLSEKDQSVSVLGLLWKPFSDTLYFNIVTEESAEIVTKRTVLSKISKIFDPMGWIAPVIVTAKIFIQSLWLIKTDWDSQLPAKQVKFWTNWYESIGQLSQLRIPRWVQYRPESVCELHGFADASAAAYGAIVYLRIFRGETSSVSMLVAKTKVAPIQTLSIPKLELCAAVLLAELTTHCINILQLSSVPIFLWSDSKDVLYWLASHPSKWKVFVANRCSKIHALLPTARWRHVKSQENPADLASRGLPVRDFLDNGLWFNGPDWLLTFQDSKVSERISPDTLVLGSSGNSNDTAALIVCRHSPKIWDLLYAFSDYNKLIRITIYCLRFVAKCVLRRKLKVSDRIAIFSSSEAEESVLFARENAILFWIGLVQQSHFSKEIKLLKVGGSLPSNNLLIKLTPKWKDGFLRVGGRLTHSLLDEDCKNPYILPHDSYFTTLLVLYLHRITLHGGVQLTLSNLRMKFWVIRGRQVVKNIIHRCTACIRYRASPAYQLMGDMPCVRVRPANVFQYTGVDYAGPIKVRPSKGRGRTSMKGYICIFICLATKAVHLEIVSSYASAEFIAAFERFTARRGHCQTLWSDQGTTFVGADAELRNLFTKSSQHSKDIVGFLANEGTQWKYNSPAAPHQGGIWEAAVKSVKHHLKRVLGEHTLTFEEMSTLLCKIEACLNSRPLVKLSDDPSDGETLTPAHFLIGRQSFILPHPRITEEKIPPVKRWRLVTQMNQHFWDEWSSHYLQSLQSRSKWNKIGHVFNVNDIVLVKNEQTSPGKWPLGRIVRLNKGRDGLVRSVAVKTATTELERPVVKIIPLISEVNEFDN